MRPWQYAMQLAASYAKVMPSDKPQHLDIENRDDLMRIMQRFYQLMLDDKELAPIFTDVAQIHLEEHLPVLVDFWEGILFGSGNYRNNPMAIHLDLNRKFPLTKRHFDIWLRYFNQSVDELFKGERADQMKVRAMSIATVMQIKMVQANATG